MLNIKVEIGARIMRERQAKRLTRKALAELTDDLKPSRINNWERGLRTPGPAEIKQLAKALEVSPGYLMCLTEDKQVAEEFPWLGALIPLLSNEQACDPKTYLNAIREGTTAPFSFIPVSKEISSKLGENSFALHMQDDSMMPEINMNDLLIIDPDQVILPGKLVVVQLHNTKAVTVRRYKQLPGSNNSIQEYELIVANNNWANVRGSLACEHKIVGVVLAFFRIL